MRWANVKHTAYNTAFNELIEEGYLVKKEGTKDIYTFYDKSQRKDEIVTIEYPKETVEETREIKRKLEAVNNKEYHF